MKDHQHQLDAMTHRWYSYSRVNIAITSMHAAMKCLVWNARLNEASSFSMTASAKKGSWLVMMLDMLRADPLRHFEDTNAMGSTYAASIAPRRTFWFIFADGLLFYNFVI